MNVGMVKYEAGLNNIDTLWVNVCHIIKKAQLYYEVELLIDV